MKSLTFLALVILLSSCSSENFVEVKDDRGNIVERYQIDKDSIRNGAYESFGENGILISKSSYSQGVQTGMRTIFFENGLPEIIENYENGKLNGSYKVYYESGELQIESIYTNNAINGKVKKFYKSGQLMEDVTFVDSEENGPFTEYWENGNLKWEGEYRKGDNEYGELKKYNEEGILIRKLMCDDLAVCRTFWTLEEDGFTEE